MARISIGLPVFNGERFLRAALDSILTQSFGDYELIIADNASTDATSDICREYCARDARVRYHRNPTNLGPVRNFNLVFELARAEYFAFAADDDVYAPSFLEQCVAVLDQDPSVVLCHCATVFIDEHGERIPFDRDRGYFVDRRGYLYRRHDRPRNFGSARPWERYAEVLLATHWCFEMFGLMRRETLRRTALFGPFYGADKALLAELALLGRFAQVPEPLFFRRCHARQSAALQTSREREAWTNPQRSRPRLHPRFRCGAAYLRALGRADLSLSARVRCLLQFMRWLVKWENWRKAMREMYGPRNERA